MVLFEKTRGWEIHKSCNSCRRLAGASNLTRACYRTPLRAWLAWAGCPCLDEERIRLAKMARQSPIPSPPTQNMALHTARALSLSRTGGQCQLFNPHHLIQRSPSLCEKAKGKGREDKEAVGGQLCAVGCGGGCAWCLHKVRAGCESLCSVGASLCVQGRR